MRVAKILRTPSAEEIQNRTTTIKLSIEPQEYRSDYSIVDDSNKKKLKSYVKTIKSLMRSSYEYKGLMKFLKEKKGMSMCGYHPNIDIDMGFPIHIHHYPYCAEDIIYTVIYKRAERNECLKMTSILEEVMMLHYIGLIGLYPFCETCHEFEHSLETDDFIPLDLLYGSPDEFYNIYGRFMAEELQNKSKTYFKANESYKVIESNIPDALIRNMIYVTDDSGLSTISLGKLIKFVQDVMR